MIDYGFFLDRELEAGELAVFVADVLGVSPGGVYVGPEDTDPGGPAPKVWWWYAAVDGDFRWSVSVAADDTVSGPDELTFVRRLSRHFDVRVLLGTESPSYEEWRLITGDEDRIVHLDMAEFDNDRFILAADN